MYSYEPPHMAKQKQDDQLEPTYSSYVKTQDATLKTCRRRWMIGRSGERGSGISVLAARHDDDDDDDLCILLHSLIFAFWSAGGRKFPRLQIIIIIITLDTSIKVRVFLASIPRQVIPKTLFSILADHNITVFWIFSSIHPISISSRSLTKPLGNVSRVSIKINITDTFIFHSLFYFFGKV